MSGRTLLVVLVCLGAAVVETVVPHLLHLRAARADLLLGIVLYLALNDEWVQGATLSLCAGLLADVCSTGPAGLYSFLAVLSFVVTRLTAAAFKADQGPRVIVLGFSASLLHTLAAALIFRFALREDTFFSFHLGEALWSALATAAGTLLVFRVLRRLDESLLQEEAAARAARGGF